jgi:hypothetical protein
LILNPWGTFMALGDLSSRSAVLQALAEYDRLGPDAFLRRYGFGRARAYYLLRDGRRYDSKAIAGAAHGYQFPQLGPLHAADFSGGEATVASKLRSLGFDVITDHADPMWDIAVGQTLKRRELQQRYGGAPFGGIEPSRSTPNVLLFTDPTTGQQYGYFDGWADDGCFHYTGEGQRGDQRFREGNKAIRDHVSDGRNLRLFRASGRDVTYLGAFNLDSEQPSYFTDAPETGGGSLRTVIVFRLRPLGDFLRRDSEGMAFASAPAFTEVPVEAQHQERYRIQRREPTEAERREASLVHRYRLHLEQRGAQVIGLAIRPGHERRPLYCDLFNKTDNELIEAKGSVTREAIRLGLGQLLDYRRFITPTPRMVLLVPMRPRPDLLELLHTHGISVVWEEHPGHFSAD